MAFVRTALITLALFAYIELLQAEDANSTRPIMKATTYEDVSGTYYRSLKTFDFCTPELEISATGTTINSLSFNGDASCGSGPWGLQIYADSGSSGWGITVGQRVQSKSALTCSGTKVSLMVIRPERDWVTDKPVWGSDIFYTYNEGVKHVTFVQNEVGHCIYATKQLCEDGVDDYPACGSGGSTGSDGSGCSAPGCGGSVPNSGGGLSGGAIGGIIAGLIVVLLICAAAVVLFKRWKKKKTRHTEFSQADAVPEATYY